MIIRVLTIGGDRFKHFGKRMADKKIKWTFAKSFNKNEIDDFRYRFSDSEVYEDDALIARAKSHFRLWNECMVLQQPMLILDDAAAFSSEDAVLAFNDFISKDQTYDHDIIFLDEGKNAEESDSYSITEASSIHLANAYVITPKAAEKIIKQVEKFKGNIDSELQSHEDLKIGAFSKPIFLMSPEEDKEPERPKQRVVIARNWREFNKQQVDMIVSLYDIFGKDDVHLHICISGDIDNDLLEGIMKSMSNWKFNLYSTHFFDIYAETRGAKDEQIEKFSAFEQIYHILLYHYLWFNLGERYLLIFDDDLSFDKNHVEIIQLIRRFVPFYIGEKNPVSNMPLFGKLILHFGNWILDEYYTCENMIESSSRGLMGIINKEIFSPFASHEDFRKMLDMFEYKQASSKEAVKWEDVRLLSQEQSFLKILNRSFSKRQHLILHEKRTQIT